MTNDQIQNLFYLIHDKSHILPPGKTGRSGDILFTPDTLTCLGVALYRGLAEEDVSFLEAMLSERAMFSTYPGYLSFSENLRVAKSFARGYKTRNLLQIIKPRTKAPEGINIPSLLEPEINQADPEEIFILKSAEQEREWIFRKPRIIIKRVDLRDGYRIWKATLVTL